MHQPPRKCLICGTPFRGRSDKKYCSKACRNVASNRTRTELARFIKPHIDTFTNNLKALKSLIGEESEARVHRDTLMRSGFNPDGPTRKMIDEEDGRKVFHVVGPFILKVISGNKFLIKKNNFND